MLKIIISEEFAKHINTKVSNNIDLTIVNTNNIIEVMHNDKYDGFILSADFDDYLYKIRNTSLYHTACIVSYNSVKRNSLYTDFLINEEPSVDNVNKAFTFINDFFTMPSKETILSLLKRLMIAADSDLETQLYRVPILTNFIVECLKKEGMYENELTDDFVNDLITYSAYHDVGKISIVHEVLNFSGKYDAYHRRTMNYHPKLGKQFYDLLSSIFPCIYSQVGANIMLYHHEKFDGSGYPIGLIADEIPLEARIVAVADVYDALRSKRKYKDPFSHEDSFNILLKDASTHFDPVLIIVLEKYEKELENIYNDLI